MLLARGVVTDKFVPTLARLGHRCRPGLHYDLHDQIKGPAGGVKLAHFCAAFSIPAKIGGEGGGVADLAEEGRWLDIEHYCETDVVATWLAAQMWESSEDPGFGRKRWNLLARWLERRSADNPRLIPFCNVPAARTSASALIEPTF